MSAPLKPILIVLHRDSSTPGRIGHALKERGYPLDARHPCLGDPLPDTLAEHAGAIIFGGPASALLARPDGQPAALYAPEVAAGAHR